MKKCVNCKNEFPTSIKIDGKKRNLGNRVYCLECRPFGSKERKPLVEKETLCVLCQKSTKQGRTRCPSCSQKIRRHRSKLAAIKMLGGKCNRCGYDEHWAALEFHHCKGDKDFTIANVGNKCWELIKSELEKCELLCSNCHRIEHSDRDDPKFIEEVEKYKGKQLNWKNGQ